MAERENSSKLSINDAVCQEAGVKAAWGLGNHLHVSAGCCVPQRDGSSGIQVNNALIHEVKWDTTMHTSITRKLVNETRGIFIKLQKQHEQPINIKKSMMLTYSREYRSVIKACVLDTQKVLGGDNVGGRDVISEGERRELTAQVEMFEMMELLWSLCEIIFINVIPGGSVLLQLLDWLRLHFVDGDNKANNVVKSDAPHEHPEYWNAINCFLLQGRQEEARGLLSLHPRCASQSFSTIDRLIRTMPVYSASAGQSFGEFENRWRQWQVDCSRCLDDGSLTADDQLVTICRVLCGHDEVFYELREQIGTWYCMMISRLLYQNPTVKSTDLQYHSKFCVDAFGGVTCLQPWDVIILAAVELDIHQVIRECSTSFSNWWLVAHLTDLLHHREVLEPRVLNFGSNLREFLLLEYATSLISHQSLWQVAIEYLEYCPVFGRAYTAEFIVKIPLDTEWKAEKILNLCQKYELEDEFKSICKIMGVKALHNRRLGSALSWGLRSKDAAFIATVTEELLDEYSASGDFSNLDLVDNLGSAMLLTSKLTFLGKYREFHKLYADGALNDASKLLLSLLTSQTAPRKFWFNLLLDAIPLLDRDSVVFGTEQTYALLHCLEEMEMSRMLETDESQVGTEMNESEKDRLSLLRLSLARNLARAIVCAV